MSIELINRIAIKKDGVYLSTHSSNDNAPYHSVRIKLLSDVYCNEGKKGLYKEIIKMLCEYGELRGNHNSLQKYYYALNSSNSNEIRKKYLDLNNYYYNLLSDEDKNSLYSNNISEKAKEYKNHSKNLYDEMYSKIADKCFEFDIIRQKSRENSRTFDYYQKIISNIYNVSEEYNVDFDNKIPFQNFGSDDEAAYGVMSSFSNYYKDILKKLNINVDNISTDSWSDGKYKITFESKYIFDLTTWDSIDNVIDNIESIMELLKEKESEMIYE